MTTTRKEKQMLILMRRAAAIKTMRDTRFEGRCYKVLDAFEDMLHYTHTRGDIMGGERYTVKVLHERLLSIFRENRIPTGRDNG
jgi:hypothetical protein